MLLKINLPCRLFIIDLLLLLGQRVDSFQNYKVVLFLSNSVVQLSAFESLSISMARSYSDCKVFSQCMELSDSIELKPSNMFLICHKANNYAALNFAYMKIIHVKIYNFHLIFIES